MVSQFRLFEKLVERENDQARVEAAERLVALDPLRESSQRILMQAYCDAGENGLALKQYERCRELLRRELNVEPARETQDLRERIGAGSALVGRSIPAAEKGAGAPLYLSVLASLGPSATSNLMPSSARGSIAVLPFINMSGDPEQEFFTDGLTEDLITDLSNVPGLFVIARNSTSAYKGRPTDVRQIARDLGVRYILEGSARRSETRLRINVQLSDAAESGLHVWAERFDRQMTDIFDVQDEVTRLVVHAISGKLGVTDIPERYRPSNLEAYDLCVRSRDRWTISKSANDEARSLQERAIALDPDYCEAHWQLANTLIFGWQLWGDPKEPNLGDALALAQRAVDIDPNDSTARSTLGYTLLYHHRWAEAEQQYDAAIRLNPNNAHAFADLAYFHVMNGKPQEAVASAARALRLNPRPPGWYFWVTGTAQVANGQYSDAVATLRREKHIAAPRGECLQQHWHVWEESPKPRRKRSCFLRRVLTGASAAGWRPSPSRAQATRNSGRAPSALQDYRSDQRPYVAATCDRLTDATLRRGRPRPDNASIGAGDGNRTHDMQLGKLPFYH